MPSVPTLKEAGVNVVYDVNRGIMVPKGTPADVIGKLGSSCAAAAKAVRAGHEAAGHRRAHGPQHASWLKQNDDLNRNLAKDLGLLKR